MKTCTVLLVCGVLVSFASAEPLITNIDNRQTTSLNGRWRTIVDPYEKGYLDWLYQPKEKGIFLDEKPKDNSSLIEYDFDASPLLHVPGDWNSQRPELLYYEGSMWYRTTFDYTLPPGKRLFVHFGAANYHTIAWLNGKKLGEHLGGATPFNFEITDKVQPAGNFLIVKVNNERKREYVPAVKLSWWNFGGLTRSVCLIETPQTFIEDYFVQLKKGDSQTLAGWVRLNGPQLKQTITVEIPELGSSLSIDTDRGQAQFQIKTTPQLWSPANPKLYDVVIRCDTDKLEDQIGFRTIEVQGDQILLNGKPIFLRGICMSEEVPMQFGKAYSAEHAMVMLDWARQLHCNFVRLAHWPYHEPIIRLADKLGIMVWSEIPVYWAMTWENPDTRANAMNQLREMIARDKNRAAVICWSLGNETDITDARNSLYKEMADTARSLDPTRLITAALERHHDEKDPNLLVVDDPVGEYLDVIGCNEYMGWYHELPGLIGHFRWKMVWNKPLIMSEFGGGARAGLHGDRLTRWTEEFQEYLMQDQLVMLKNIPFLRGTCPWILYDFPDPYRMLPGIQDYYNRKGLISDKGLKKKAFYVIRDFYRQMEQDSQ